MPSPVEPYNFNTGDCLARILRLHIFSSESGDGLLVPTSCCKEGADCNPGGIKSSDSEEDIKAKIYTKGCVSKLQTILKEKKILIGILAFVILIGFFLAVVTSCNLAREMSEENMSEDPKYHRHSIYIKAVTS